MTNVEGYQAQLHALGGAHLLLALCCACYLAWWCVFFRPRAARPHGVEYGVGVALIVAAALLGLVAVARMGGSLMELPSDVPAGILWPAAIAAYGAIAYLSARFLDRPITTELVLIVAWTALEIAVVGAVSAASPGAPVRALVAVVAIACVGSLACYLAYYRLAGWAAFLDGCGPLVAVGLLSVAFAILI